MATEFIMRRAIHPGRDHTEKDALGKIAQATPCQDAIYALENKSTGIITGIVCDGCGSGRHSEIGATLGSVFLANWAYALWVRYGSEGISHHLFDSLKAYLINIMSGFPALTAPSARANFIRDHFLFTVLGFVMTQETTVIFSAGDGTLVINDDPPEFLGRDDGFPLFPGYKLIDPALLTENQRSAIQSLNRFEVVEKETSKISRLAIGSDAWEEEKELIPQIWGFDKPIGLQLQVNLWWRDRHFRDDVSIITVEIERTPDENP